MMKRNEEKLEEMKKKLTAKKMAKAFSGKRKKIKLMKISGRKLLKAKAAESGSGESNGKAKEENIQ